MKEIKQARARDVEIRLMVSGKRIDIKLPLWAGRNTYSELMRWGVTIEEYDRTLLHTKLLIVDEQIVMFGSANMNQRSQTLDEELSVVCRDEQLARELLDDIAQDRDHCRQIEPERWAQRSVLMRASEKFARLFAPQL